MEFQKPWLVCQNGRKGKKRILLAQDQEAYYAVDAYGGLTRKKENFLEEHGVSEAILQKLELPYERICKSSVRGVSISGYSAADAVYLYLDSGKRLKFLLKVNHLKDHVESFFGDLKRFEPPRDKKQRKWNSEAWRREGRDQELFEAFRYAVPALTAFGFVSALCYVCTDSWIWFSGCLITVASAVALDILYPRYFTLIMAGKGKTSDAWELSWAFFGVMFFLIMSPSKNWLNDRDFWLTLLLSGVVGTVILGFLAEEFRRRRDQLPLVFLIAAFFGFTLIGHANEVFDFRDPQVYVLQVQELQSHESRRVDTFECTVTLPDGREAELDISRSLYNELEVGDLVRVEHSVGALGIEYANAYPVDQT